MRLLSRPLSRSLRAAPSSLAAMAALALLPWAAQAAEPAAWPQHPVTLIMGFNAGSGVDMVGRSIQEPVSQRLGQPIIIDYKSGAAGNIGSEYVRAPSPMATRCTSAPPPRTAATPRCTRTCPSMWRPTSSPSRPSSTWRMC